MTGSPTTQLIVLRGNSGSGKSTTAHALQRHLGRGTAWVDQDHFRRKLLWELDHAGGTNIGLLGHTARYLLDHGHTVVLEGIMDSRRYGGMLQQLTADHRGLTLHYYFDIPFDETVKRHGTRPLAAEFGPDSMLEWYRERDLLDGIEQEIIDVGSTLEQTVGRIAGALGRGPGDNAVPLEG